MVVQTTLVARIWKYLFCRMPVPSESLANATVHLRRLDRFFWLDVPGLCAPLQMRLFRTRFEIPHRNLRLHPSPSPRDYIWKFRGLRWRQRISFLPDSSRRTWRGRGGDTLQRRPQRRWGRRWPIPAGGPFNALDQGCEYDSSNSYADLWVISVGEVWLARQGCELLQTRSLPKLFVKDKLWGAVNFSRKYRRWWGMRHALVFQHGTRADSSRCVRNVAQGGGCVVRSRRKKRTKRAILCDEKNVPLRWWILRHFVRHADTCQCLSGQSSFLLGDRRQHYRFTCMNLQVAFSHCLKIDDRIGKRFVLLEIVSSCLRRKRVYFGWICNCSCYIVVFCIACRGNDKRITIQRQVVTWRYPSIQINLVVNRRSRETAFARETRHGKHCPSRTWDNRAVIANLSTNHSGDW